MGLRRAPLPLDEPRLNELAVRYVGRFATTRAKLRTYLQRKIRERGWAEAPLPDLELITDRFAELGYIDDAGFALAKSRTLTGRGYGKRRVVEALRLAGVDDEDGESARHHADAEAVSAALRFAERRRIGPFSDARSSDPRDRERALAAMIRAGHPFSLSKLILALTPGEEIDREGLAEQVATSA